MPEEEKKKPSEIPVDIDTSGPEVDVAVEEAKDESVVDTAAKEETVETVETKKEGKEEKVET